MMVANPVPPKTIRTGCSQLDRAWKTNIDEVYLGSDVLINDTEEDLNWHAFLGHSLDMMGFRAAEFVGVDRLTKMAPQFIPLKTLGLGIPEFAALWHVSGLRSHLNDGCKHTPFQTTLDALRRTGIKSARDLADAFQSFPYKKNHKTARAYLHNSAALAPYRHSFRNWLVQTCAELGEHRFPPPDFRAPVGLGDQQVSLERGVRIRLEQQFFMVGPAIAAYMIADWQLALWKDGKTGVFESYKQDLFHERFVEKHGAGLIPSDQPGFVAWWHHMYPDLPPRLVNECIWLAIEHNDA